MRVQQLIILFSLIGSPVAAQDAAVFPKGSSFGVVPFKGSQEAADFSGFVDLETARSVMITELPKEAATELFAQMPDQTRLASQGITAERIESLQIAGLPALRIEGTQEAPEIGIFPKCLILIEGTNSTGMITAQMPLDTEGNACDLINGIIERAPLTLAQRTDALPFRVTALGNMRIANTLAGSALQLSKPVANGSSEPMIMIAHSLSSTPGQLGPEERMLLSVQMFNSLTNYTNFDIESTYDVQIDDAPGTAIMAAATETGSEREVRLIQWVRFDQNGTIRMICESNRDEFRDHFADFQTVRDGLKAR